jgi:hypothetical protein
MSIVRPGPSAMSAISGPSPPASVAAGGRRSAERNVPSVPTWRTSTRLWSCHALANLGHGERRNRPGIGGGLWELSEVTVTFAIHGYDDADPAEEFGPMQAEFERRGFPCRYIRSPRRRTRTPHRDRAQVVTEGLRDVEGDVALLGISNQGLFLPLVAAARPVRRIVLINAAVPRPGRSFREASRHERVYANVITRLLGRISPGMSEVCPLTELPKTEYVYIAGDKDDALRPEWEQWQAREFLHVEPVVIRGAGHVNIVLDHVDEVVDAATRDFAPPRSPVAAGTRSEPVRLPHQQPEAPGAGIAGFLIGNLAPLAIYLACHAFGASDTKALGIAWLFPVVWTFAASWARRRVNVPGLVGAVVYGAALFVSVFAGGGALPLKLRRAVVSGVIGLVCLVSVALRRPVLVLLARRRTRVRPRMEKRLRRLTLLVGMTCLANAALETVLALCLSTRAFLLTSAAIHVSVAAGVVAGLVGWLLWTGRA